MDLYHKGKKGLFPSKLRLQPSIHPHSYLIDTLKRHFSQFMQVQHELTSDRLTQSIVLHLFAHFPFPCHTNHHPPPPIRVPSPLALSSLAPTLSSKLSLYLPHSPHTPHKQIHTTHPLLWDFSRVYWKRESKCLFGIARIQKTTCLFVFSCPAFQIKSQ